MNQIKTKRIVGSGGVVDDIILLSF
jgi:hypothetical protein